MNQLEGKVALISGTAGGQGRAAALLFAKAGARVFGCDVNAEGAAETVEMVTRAGGIMKSLAPLDPSDPEHAERWAKAAHDAFGGIDILYNNGGSLRAFGPFDASTFDDWNLTIRYELTIVYASTKAVWPYLVERGGGVIVSTASTSAYVESPPFRSSAHGAAKAGVVALARMFAAEGRHVNIRSNSISPGLINVPATKSFHAEDKVVGDMLISKIPMGRMGEPDEIAQVALFLASPAASYVNGADFIVDGGMLAVNNTPEKVEVDYAASPLLAKARTEHA
jgi:meso-butanediol dehydrogenase / (S,S)-butanediol dehydrogenase / diacetyl reductase